MSTTPFASFNLDGLHRQGSGTSGFMLSNPPNPTRSAAYYIDTVTFLVENSLYKVQRAPFIQNSQVFKDMFTKSPQIASHTARGSAGAATASFLLEEGLVDELPIKLEQTKKDDFEALLSVMFPKQPGSVPSLSLSQWYSISELSRKWLMKDYYHLACENITATFSPGENPMETIRFARSYKWSISLAWGYLGIVQRLQPPSLQEAQEIGLDTYFGILGPQRERHNHADAMLQCRHCYDCEYDSVKSTSRLTAKTKAEINELFAGEIAQLQAELDNTFAES